MGKSDIVASLKLNSTDYEQKLAKAKESTRKFSKDGGQGLTDMVGKFKGLAVAVAGSKAVMETFNAVIKSSQTIGDAYTQSVEGAKGAVSEFVYAMANADFSGFNGGLRSIIGNAREAAIAMDSLGNAQISYDYLTAGYRSSFKTNVTSAKDKEKSTAERKEYLNAAYADLAKMEDAVAVYADKTIKAVIENAKAKANNVSEAFVTRENIDRIMALDITSGGEEEKQRLANLYKQFKELRTEATNLEDIIKRGEKWGRDVSQYKARLDEINAITISEDMQMAALYNAMLVKGTDEWLQEMTSLVIKSDNAKASLAEMQASIFEVANQLNQPIKSGTVGEAFTPRMGTIAGFNGTPSALPNTLSPIKPVTMTDDEYAALVAARGEAEEYAAALEVLNNTSVSASEGLGALGNAFGNMSGMLGEGAGAWMNYAGGIISAVGSALPSLEALAAAQAAAVVTKTALSPWTVVSGIAAVTSIIAAMAQIPKFATGGVVPGNALSGDNVLIRANSGEVVLTKQQANNIGSALAGFGGNVRFVIEGDKLVGVLNNHNSITSRSYGH